MRPRRRPGRRRWSRRTSGAATRGLLARVRLQALVSAYGWSLWGVDPGGGQRPRLRLRRAGACERFEKAARGFTSAGFDAPAGGGRAVRLTSPSRARVVVVGGGVIGTSHGLPPDPARAGPTCCCWSRAPCRAARPGTRPGWSARCGRRRAAPGWCSTPPSSTPRLEAETGLATGYRNVRRRHRRPHRGPDGAAAAHRRERRRLRPRVRDAHPRRGRRAVAARCAVDDLLGAIWLPGDGKVNPTDLTQSLAQGRPAARRAGRRAGAGDRLRRRRRAGRAPGDRRAHRPRRRRGRGRRELRRPVGQGARRRWPASRCRCTRPSTSTSSPTQVEGVAPRPADHARPRRLDLLQGGGRRPGRRRLRARGEAVGRARRDPVPVRVRSCSTRTGSTSRC